MRVSVTSASPARIVAAASSRSTYLASTSISRLTWFRRASVGQRRLGERVRDQRDLEAVLVDARRRSARRRRRRPTLLDAVAEQLAARLDPHAHAVALGLDRGDTADAVDVALDLVAAERIAGTQRGLEVDARRRTASRGRASPGRRRRRAARRCSSTTVRQTPSTATESPSSAGSDASTTSLPSSNESTVPTSRTSPVNMPEAASTARGGTPRAGRPRRPAARQVHEPERGLEPGTSERPVAGERRRDEEQQLVDQPRVEERARERRAALEQQRLDAVGGERAQLLLERTGAQLELRALRERPAPEREPARLPRRLDVARVEPRVLEPHRAHPDGDGVGRGAQLVHEPARLLARDPALAGDGDAAVERDRRLVGDERAPERRPRAPRLVLATRLEAVRQLRLDALLRVSRASPPPASGFGSSEPATTRAIPAARTASTQGGVVPWWTHGSIVTKSVAPRARSPGRRERDDLAVAALRLGRPLADDLAVRDDDRSDRRLRIRPA